MVDAVTTTTTPVNTTSAANAADLTSGQTQLASANQTFLKLLTTQLQNQDPTAPLDSNQFTQQLVQLTGVQQQLLSNQLLQQLVTAGSGGTGVSGAVGLIGKTVSSTTATNVLAGGDANWTYTLPANANSATLSVQNSTGGTVWTGAVSDLSAGSHAFDWKGVSTNGNQLPDGGTYTLTVAAQDASGASLTTSVGRQGVVNSVSTDATGAVVLNLASGSVPLSSVSRVSAGS